MSIRYMEVTRWNLGLQRSSSIFFDGVIIQVEDRMTFFSLIVKPGVFFLSYSNRRSLVLNFIHCFTSIAAQVNKDINVNGITTMK
jgi:hypothetical protein